MGGVLILLIAFLLNNELCAYNWLFLVDGQRSMKKAINQLVSKRQKHNGMSWTDKGSQGLAKLISLDINKERQLWLNSGRFDFRFRKKAA